MRQNIIRREYGSALEIYVPSPSEYFFIHLSTWPHDLFCASNSNSDDFQTPLSANIHTIV